MYVYNINNNWTKGDKGYRMRVLFENWDVWE